MVVNAGLEVLSATSGVRFLEEEEGSADEDELEAIVEYITPAEWE